MRICILANKAIERDFSEKPLPEGIAIFWKSELSDLISTEADAYFDLLFENDANRIQQLKTLLPAPVFIHSMVDTLVDIGEPFIRMNAWPGFLSVPVIEIAILKQDDIEKVNGVMNKLGWKYKQIPDQAGMITARVVSMIVNEAYFALGEGVSTKQEIDIAMKLGTNYPKGPFEWAEEIGIDKIAQLLTKLSEQDERYLLADALKEEARF